MRLSEGKINRLSHLIADALAEDNRVEFKDVWNEVRLSIRNRIILVLEEDEKIGREVEERIRSMKRNIPEGGPEWDVLYRKYYGEEVEKLRSIR